MSAENPFVAFIARYRDDPVLFVMEVLDEEPLDYQAEFLRALAAGERKMSVRSGHGTGKSTTAAWAMLWFLLTRYPAKVVVTAPTSGQLFDALFAELTRWVNRLPEHLRNLLNTTGDRVELVASPEGGFISARTSRAEKPEALAGIHAEHVLIVVDEASGVPEPVYEAALGSMSGESATTILLGNPTRSSGTFFETHTRLAGSWWTRRWSCLDSPLVSDKFVEEVRQRYGEESNAYRVRVLGEFPLGDDDTIVPLYLAEEARHRDITHTPGARPIWGLDVARFGSDRTALAEKVGQVVTGVEAWRGLDLMQTVGRVRARYEALPADARPSVILVDSIGLGSGVVDRMRELGMPVRGVNVSESPAMGETYVNLRTELIFKARAWLEQRNAKLPHDSGLIAEMTSIRYSFTSSGKMRAESKDDLRKRVRSSPDKADAVFLLFAEDAASALGVVGRDWGRPLRRNLRGIA